jgi:ADP-ribose pyrophosphatase YjhB (NUDIX family)
VFRPRTLGVKCVVEHDGRWLMIRNTYGRHHWTLPGGGVRRRERPDEAARREVREEVGIELAAVEPIGSYFSRRHYSRDTVHCFRARVDASDFRIDGKEVLEASWFAPTDIPEKHGAAVDEVLRLLAV